MTIQGLTLVAIDLDPDRFAPNAPPFVPSILQLHSGSSLVVQDSTLVVLCSTLASWQVYACDASPSAGYEVGGAKSAAAVPPWPPRGEGCGLGPRALG